MQNRQMPSLLQFATPSAASPAKPLNVRQKALRQRRLNRAFNLAQAEGLVHQSAVKPGDTRQLLWMLEGGIGPSQSEAQASLLRCSNGQLTSRLREKQAHGLKEGSFPCPPSKIASVFLLWGGR